MEKYIDVLIPVVTALVGTLLGGFLPFLSSCADRKLRYKEINQENLKTKLKKMCDQYLTFYKLEEKYTEEIAELRSKTGKEYLSDGIRNEFRNKIYKHGFTHLDYSDNSIINLKNDI